MKSRSVPFLVFALLLCLGALVVQRHYYRTQMARQEQAITLVQSEADTLRKEASAARQIEAKRQSAHAAMIAAKSIAPRYDSLRKISGYEKKTAKK